MAKRKDGKLTLQQFVKRFTSQDAAANEIGVRIETVNRWLNGALRLPTHGLAKRRFDELGIST